MRKYDPKSIEPKWQQAWADTKLYAAVDGDPTRPKYYMLTEFPYPSAAGLHAGHVREYTLGDVIARHKRMLGHNVLYPMGYDAFGLPTENYAIKTGVKPQVATDTNVAIFRRQFESLGISFDWDREVNTSDPQYYRWTQWLFLQFFKHNLAYQDEIAINWCPFEKTGLANEEVVDGKHERCGTPVEKKLLKQWLMAITKYADRLIDGLKSVDFPSRIADQQINWIGRSEGAEIDFAVGSMPANYILLHGYTGSPESDFHPWLRRQLAPATVQIPALPNTENPVVMDQVEYVLQNCTFDADTILLGHSLGAAVALKVVERLTTPIRKLVLAAGFAQPGFSDHGRPFESTFDWKFDFEAIKKNVGDIEILRAENDGAVPRARADYLAKLLDAPITDFVAEGEHICGEKEPQVLKVVRDNIVGETITVYTTRPDTLAGATFLVLAPEHPVVAEITTPEQTAAVEHYVANVASETERDRETDERPKTGVFTGAFAKNPITHEPMPVWVADYVLAGYGTGAIMAVPAHDERDFAFAKAFDLPIKDVIAPTFGAPVEGEVKKRSVISIVRNPRTNEVIVLNWGPRQATHGGNMLIGGTMHDGEDAETTARREITEETGYTDLKLVKTSPVPGYGHFYAEPKKHHAFTTTTGLYFELQSDERTSTNLDDGEVGKFKIEWRPVEKVLPLLDDGIHAYYYKTLMLGEAMTGAGIVINSGQFDGLTTAEAARAVADWLAEQGLGRRATQYRLHDWIFSRQHYWGEPIPIIHCPQCAAREAKPKLSLNFYDQPTWQAILDGVKTVESRALNPDEPGRNFGAVEVGDVLELVNKETGETVAAQVQDARHYESLAQFHTDTDWATSCSASGQLKPLAEWEKGFAYTPDYLERIKANGLVAWKIRLLTKSVAVPDDQLPVRLPDVEHYEPTDDGRSPLAAITDWVNVACPECGGQAKRETDTMPNWAGSSWYYLRYMDPRNAGAFADRRHMDYWGMVDLYLGGMEHTTLHLLYSRFWHQFLYDRGLVPTPEPYAARRGQGIVLATDGRKMSKSLGNVVNPTDIIARYGADALRLYIMFMAPYDETTPWSDERLGGVSRFLYRAWDLAQAILEAHGAGSPTPIGGSQENTGTFETIIDRATHKTLKKAHDDLGTMRFNTMISTLMEYLNTLTAAKTRAQLLEPEYAALARRTLRTFVLMLAPAAPHVAEELWHELGETGSVHVAAWPEYDPALLHDDIITVVAQVNGKVRAQLALPADVSEAEATAAAAADPNVAKHLEGQTIVKTIVVPRKLVNFVVK